MKLQLLLDALRNDRFICLLRELSFFEGGSRIQIKKTFIKTADSGLFSFNGIVLIQTVIHTCVERTCFYFRTGRNEGCLFRSDIAKRRMPGSIVLYSHCFLAADFHVRHSENRRYQEHGKNNTDPGQSAFFSVHFCGERNKVKIRFHMYAPPRSLRTPSWTRKT